MTDEELEAEFAKAWAEHPYSRLRAAVLELMDAVYEAVGIARLSLLREREEEIRRLREALDWLVHLNRGVSRGGGAPSMAEWEDAWQNAEWLVRGEQP